MAVAARADPPAIDTQLAADPPPPRALRLSSIPEDTMESSNTAASAKAEANAVGGYKAGTVEEPPNYRWTNYPEGTKRKPHDHGRRIVTLVGAAPPHVPMPTRHVPVTVFGAHDIHPSQEVDWTRHPDQAEEQRLRDDHNMYIKAILKGGRACQFNAHGHSLWPRVESGGVATWAPIADHAKLRVGELVFCEVQPPAWYGARFYGLMIHEIGACADGSTQWTIGNMKQPPHMIGWCAAEHIYGVLIEPGQTE